MFRDFLHFAKAWAGTVNPAWEVQMGKYQEIYWECLDNPEFFFGKAAAGTIWLRLFDKILNGGKPPHHTAGSPASNLSPVTPSSRGTWKTIGASRWYFSPQSSHGILSEFCSPAGSDKEHDE
jgi:hypothetical protein